MRFAVFHNLFIEHVGLLLSSAGPPRGDGLILVQLNMDLKLSILISSYRDSSVAKNFIQLLQYLLQFLLMEAVI